MERGFRRKASLGSLVVMACLCLTTAAFGRAQVLNPEFIKARDMWAQVSHAPGLTRELKAPLGRRFGLLAREQRRLWGLAAQVDAGSCVDACMAAYNTRVENWQRSLVEFQRSATNTLRIIPASGLPNSTAGGGLPPGSGGGDSIHY